MLTLYSARFLNRKRHRAPGFVDRADFVVDQAEGDGAFANDVSIQAVLARFAPKDPQARLRRESAHTGKRSVKFGDAVDEPQCEHTALGGLFFERCTGG